MASAPPSGEPPTSSPLPPQRKPFGQALKSMFSGIPHALGFYSKPAATSRDRKSPQTDCPLLQLPGELRNRIYRLILVTSNETQAERIHIDVVSGYDIPGLLNSCKAVRAEALAIYYYENFFTGDIRQFSPVLPERWSRHIVALGLKPRKTGFCPFVHYDQPNWANLLRWLEIYHSGRGFLMPAPEEHLKEMEWKEVQNYIVAGLFRSAKRLRGRPWEEVREVLGDQRAAMGICHSGWEED